MDTFSVVGYSIVTKRDLFNLNNPYALPLFPNTSVKF